MIPQTVRRPSPAGWRFLAIVIIAAVFFAASVLIVSGGWQSY